MNAPAFELAHVNKSFGSLKVLEGADLTVERGESLVILGPSGSGKSVTIRLLVGLERVDEGEVIVNGQSVTHLTEREWIPLRSRMGFLFQGSALFDSLTVFENIAFPLREHGLLPEEEIPGKVREKLAMVDLENAEELYPSNLSGGMQKRVALARALAMEPETIFYDEPTTGLDPPTADTINDLIIRLRETLDVTSIVVTHDLHCVSRTAQRVALLRDHRFPIVLERDAFFASDHPSIRGFISASEVHHAQ